MDCSMPDFPILHHLPEFAQSIGASASASVLPMNIQDLFPLGLTGLISLLSKGLSRVFSTPQVESINSLALSLFMHFGELKLVWFLRVAGLYNVSGIWLQKDSLFSSQFMQVTTEDGRMTPWSFQPSFICSKTHSFSIHCVSFVSLHGQNHVTGLEMQKQVLVFKGLKSCLRNTH